jgi:hypothetical protein
MDRNQVVWTDRIIANNKPDITIHDNGKATCTLIDVAISGDRKVNMKDTDKILKHKDLTIEIQGMRNFNIKVIKWYQ